jgi:hypothetical protein
MFVPVTGQAFRSWLQGTWQLLTWHVGGLPGMLAGNGMLAGKGMPPANNAVGW